MSWTDLLACIFMYVRMFASIYIGVFMSCMHGCRYALCTYVCINARVPLFMATVHASLREVTRTRCISKTQARAKDAGSGSNLRPARTSTGPELRPPDFVLCLKMPTGLGAGSTRSFSDTMRGSGFGFWRNCCIYSRTILTRANLM